MVMLQAVLALLLVHIRWVDYCHRQVGTWPTTAACLADEPSCWKRPVSGDWVVAFGPPIMAEHQVCSYHTLPKFITGEK
jgi:hypothetical protein